MMKRRVVVTGMGAVSPIGNTVEETWDGILNQVCGIDEITHFDTTDYTGRSSQTMSYQAEKEYLEKHIKDEAS